MILARIVGKLAEAPDLIGFDRSRCLRFRIDGNDCRKCADICPSGAITVGDSLAINAGTCTECLLCVSACSSDGLSTGNENFYAAVALLRKAPSPVLGCAAKPDTEAHARTFCLGYLSEEHIIALLYFMHAPLQLNLTGCTQCRNSFIVDTLEKRLELVREKTSINVSEKIRLVRRKEELRFAEITLDRRGFFKALKSGAFSGIAGLLNNDGGEVVIGDFYANKAVSSKRQLLNRAFSGLTEQERKGIPANYYCDLAIGGSCEHCAACTAVCPTGALRAEGVESDGDLLFNSSLCNGCGICAQFCLNGSIVVSRGCDSPDPFEYSLKKHSNKNRQAEEGGRRSRRGGG